ncbi:MAG TPA: hypothetical protein DHV17_09520 [Chitinophagaceae bacterium]|nr:hypothetical protein [Chitinophagaceae bacterium]
MLNHHQMNTKKYWQKGIGFLWLFGCYHAAEYFVIDDYQPIVFISCQLLFFVSAWLIARWQGYGGLSAWGMLFRRKELRYVWIGLISGGFIYTLWFMSSLLFQMEAIVHFPGWRKGLELFFLFGLGSFLSSLSEDVLTRGYIYRHVNNRMNPALLIAFSSIVYLFNHIYRLGDGPWVWTYLLIIGFFLMLAMVRTGNIWLTLGLHWSGNLLYQATHHVMETTSLSKGHEGMVLYIAFLLLLIPVTYIVSKKSSIEKQFASTVKV